MREGLRVLATLCDGLWQLAVYVSCSSSFKDTHVLGLFFWLGQLVWYYMSILVQDAMAGISMPRRWGAFFSSCRGAAHVVAFIHGAVFRWNQRAGVFSHRRFGPIPAPHAHPFSRRQTMIVARLFPPGGKRESYARYPVSSKGRNRARAGQPGRRELGCVADAQMAMKQCG